MRRAACVARYPAAPGAVPYHPREMARRQSGVGVAPRRGYRIASAWRARGNQDGGPGRPDFRRGIHQRGRARASAARTCFTTAGQPGRGRNGAARAGGAAGTTRRYGSALRPKADSNPFAHVVPFDLAPQHRSLAAGNGRSLDLSAGPVIRNGSLQDSVEHVRGTHGMSDWGERLQEFVEEHKYYPREAADNGEQGSAVLRVTVSRDGTVKRLVLVSSSGSHLLDAAWMAVFRDNKLPPFNDDMAGKEVTFNYELDYHLIYGR